jgi:hypothetical protein
MSQRSHANELDPLLTHLCQHWESHHTTSPTSEKPAFTVTLSREAGTPGTDRFAFACRCAHAKR